MLPPPALPVPSWFNSNDHIWSSAAGAGSREDDQAETCQQSGYASEQQQQLERHEAINLIRGGGGSLINAIGRRDSVSSSNLTETTSDNAQHAQALDLADHHDQIHKGRRGGLGLITPGQFEATSSEGQDDQYHSIGQAGGGMRILDSSFGLQYGAAGTANRQQLLMNDYHQWQQQQQQHLINPANLVALSSSNSANSSLSPFQQQQQQLISGFPCKLEPADQLAVVDSMNNALLVDLGHKNNSSSNHNKNLSGMTMAHSNLTSASGEASVSSGSRDEGAPAHPPSLQQAPEAAPSHDTQQQQQPPVPIKKKRNLPGTPDPEAEVIALSPKTLLATNRFVCEICSKGFQRDQNLQLHRRGHNLPWKLRQRTSKEVRKRVYICPEVNCVHHDPARALGDLTGIKKHFCRKHGEKKWKCDKCSKRYAVQSDWKAHMKTCGTREYRCDCGTLFSRRDSFITHRAFCDALAEENSRVSAHTQVGGDGSGQSVLSGSSADQMMSDHSMMGGGGGHHALGFIQAGAAAGRAMQGAGGLHNLQQRPQQQINSLINDSAANMISSLAAAQSKWDPSNPMGLKPLITPSPKLSLWLGNGPAVPGPGQHGLISHQNDTNQLLHNLTGSSQMVSDSSFFMQPPNSRSGNMSSHNLPPNPFFNSDHNAMHGVHNSIGNHNNIAAGHHVDQGVLNQRISAGSVDHTFASPVHMMMNASSSNNNNNNNNAGVSLTSSMYNQGSGPHDQVDQQQQQAQAGAANAQMSATALLQKAAMMGATASNSPLFRSFNGSSMAPASSSSGADHSQDQHNLNMPTSLSSMAGIMTNQQGMFMRPSSSPSSGSHIMNGSAASHSAMNSIQGLLYSNSGLHPMDKNITGGGQFMSGIHADMISRYNNPGASNYNISQGAFGTLMQDKAAVMNMNQARVDQAEGGHDHKPTLDFLGIGGSAAAASGNHHIHPRDQNVSADNMMPITAGPAPGMEFLSSSALAEQKDNNLLVGHHKSLGSSSPERSPDYSS